MTINRREFLLVAAGSALAGASATIPAATSSKQARRFKAIAFDGLVIFDPRPVAALADSLLHANAPALMNAWRARQFEYQWLRALSGHYADFLQTTRESLVFALRQLQLDLAEDQRDQLVQAYAHLSPWPDVADAIQTLHGAGVRLAFVSNMTSAMLTEGVERTGLGGMFEQVLSTGIIDSYKPDPRTYRLATDKLKLPREDILFAAFAGWDVAGAKWFGYPTFWVNRLGNPNEELGVAADGSGTNMKSLVEFALDGAA